jgi:4-amino-4-deoxy-L-arabinose transferase-like glycosyltransferase
MATTTYRNIAGVAALLVALVHLLIAPSVGLGVDEAHYALYARHLEWSYYDHPPMVGWLLWLLTPVGLKEFTLRLLPTLLYLACCTLLYRVSSTKIGNGTAARGLLAVLLFSGAPIVQLLGFGLVPEFGFYITGLGF